MKLKLFFLFLSIACLCYSQTPINNFFSKPSSKYAIVTSSATIDQSVNGANLTWSFNNLTKTGSTEDTHSTPSSSEVNTYPGTTLSITTSDEDTMAENKFLIRDVSNVVSITGVTNPNLTLNYNTDNALLGSYPLNYNDSTTDTFAGDYIYNEDGTTYSGTFTGSIETTVDAYGTLITNDFGEGAYNGNVTRIKSSQNLDLNYSVFGNVGTANLTTYNYYDNNGNLVFRSNTVITSIPLLSLNQNTTSYESILNSTLTVNKIKTELYKTSIFPNPVKDILNINLSNNLVIQSIIIADINGKEVFKTKEKNLSLSVNKLQSGIYIANIITKNNRYSLKFIKK